MFYTSVYMYVSTSELSVSKDAPLADQFDPRTEEYLCCIELPPKTYVWQVWDALKEITCCSQWVHNGGDEFEGYMIMDDGMIVRYAASIGGSEEPAFRTDIRAMLGKFKTLGIRWNAGYELYGVTGNGDIVCGKCANKRSIRRTIIEFDGGLETVRSMMDLEADLQCDYCNATIENPYKEELIVKWETWEFTLKCDFSGSDFLQELWQTIRNFTDKNKEEDHDLSIIQIREDLIDGFILETKYRTGLEADQIDLTMRKRALELYTNWYILCDRQGSYNNWLNFCMFHSTKEWNYAEEDRNEIIERDEWWVDASYRIEEEAFKEEDGFRWLLRTDEQGDILAVRDDIVDLWDDLSRPF